MFTLIDGNGLSVKPAPAARRIETGAARSAGISGAIQSRKRSASVSGAKVSGVRSGWRSVTSARASSSAAVIAISAGTLAPRVKLAQGTQSRPFSRAASCATAQVRSQGRV